MDFIRHILVVSWLTKHCNKTIQFGISLSRKYKAELSVIHVMDTTWLKGWSVPMVSIEQEHKRDMEMRKAELHEIIRAMSCSIFLVKQDICDMELNKTGLLPRNNQG
ncbi:MAG: universal stress protein [Smithella sp.]